LRCQTNFQHYSASKGKDAHDSNPPVNI
jgi:hypothetical protein